MEAALVEGCSNSRGEKGDGLAMSGQEAPTIHFPVMGFRTTEYGPRGVLCFGVTRGSTSAVAGVMRKLGVFMGDDVPNNHEDQEMVNRANPRVCR